MDRAWERFLATVLLPDAAGPSTAIILNCLATVVLVVCATPLVKLFFERGAFTSEDTRVVAGVQILASLQIPFYVAGILIVRAISSLSANRILAYGNVISLTVNVALNWLFMRWIGVAGIALSTSVMYVVAFLYLYLSYTRRLARLRAERLRQPLREIADHGKTGQPQQELRDLFGRNGVLFPIVEEQERKVGAASQDGEDDRARLAQRGGR